MTEPARQAAVQAQQEARGLAHDHVSSEHLLLGLLAVRGGGAARLLDSLGLSPEMVRGRVVQRVGGGDRDSPEVIPFNPRAKRIIALAVEEAMKCGDDHVGTEHILLAVVEEHEAVAAGILRDLSIDPEHVRRLVRQAASSAKARSTDVCANSGSDPSEVTPGEDGPRVTIREMDSTTFSSAPELAQAFGSVVCEPGWWPVDTEEISYNLLGSPGAEHYQIDATRRGGVPMLVVGAP
jgi:ATP-dependent Clp protease ATP-binding subunit ClpA